MKKIFSIIALSMFTSLAYSQNKPEEINIDETTLLKTDSLIPYHKLSKKTAEDFLNQAWTYIKTYNTKSFTDLWMPDSTSPKHEGHALTKSDILKNFNMIRHYLDTALNQNLKIDHVDIDRENLKGTDSEYWIKAWFKYNEHYFKAFGFYIANKNGRWVVRDNPSTSERRKN